MHDLHDKTARCILVGEKGFLLVQHSNCSPANRGKWGLPGGRLEVGESARATLRRELKEELFVEVDEFAEVGRYRYKDRWHRVFAARISQELERWDDGEIACLRWHSPDEVDQHEVDGLLHTGFEASALRDFLNNADRG